MTAPAPAKQPPRRVPKLHDRAEYVAWRAIVGLVSLIPWRTASALGASLGKLGYRPFRIRRRVVEHQIAAALPDVADNERRRIAVGAYAHLGRVAIESARVSHMTPGAALALFHEPSGWEHVERATAEGRGAIVVSGHLGNWELGLAYLAARGKRVSAVARQMGNPLFDQYVTQARMRLGLNIIPDREAVRRLPRCIDEGDLVPMLADQGVKGLASIFVPFFGRDARTPKGPAVLALRLDAPCLFMVVPRESDGRYRTYFESIPLVSTGDRERDVRAIVTEYTARLEHWVRKYPDQYLWQHRRWRRRPDGTSEDV